MKRYSLLLLCMTTSSSYAELIITPMIGYTLGGSVEDDSGNAYDMEGRSSFSLAIEMPVEKGRVGLFYSRQSTQLEDLNINSSIQYLHFQSSLDMPISENFSGYIGVGLGGSYVDADWVDNNIGFSATGFAGLEYRFTANLALNAQIRWLGTSVDNNNSALCYSDQGNSKCLIHFESDWVNQFQSNVGMTFRF